MPQNILMAAHHPSARNVKNQNIVLSIARNFAASKRQGVTGRPMPCHVNCIATPRGLCKIVIFKNYRPMNESTNTS